MPPPVCLRFCCAVLMCWLVSPMMSLPPLLLRLPQGVSPPLVRLLSLPLLPPLPPMPMRTSTPPCRTRTSSTHYSHPSQEPQTLTSVQHLTPPPPAFHTTTAQVNCSALPPLASAVPLIVDTSSTLCFLSPMQSLLDQLTGHSTERKEEEKKADESKDQPK